MIWLINFVLLLLVKRPDLVSDWKEEEERGHRFGNHLKHLIIQTKHISDAPGPAGKKTRHFHTYFKLHKRYHPFT